MAISVGDRRLSLSANLTENITLETWRDTARRAMSQANNSDVLTIDLERVERVNSAGVYTLIEFHQTYSGPIEYENLPMVLVEQINCTSIFMNINVRIKSFFAPFYDVNEDTFFLIRLIVGADVPLLNSYSHFEVPKQWRNEKELKPDFEPEDYFFFLTEQARCK